MALHMPRPEGQPRAPSSGRAGSWCWGGLNEAFVEELIWSVSMTGPAPGGTKALPNKARCRSEGLRKMAVSLSPCRSPVPSVLLEEPETECPASHLHSLKTPGQFTPEPVCSIPAQGACFCQSHIPLETHRRKELVTSPLKNLLA